MNNARYTIQPATIADINEIINLCEAHALYEQATYDRNGKAELLTQFLFGSTAQLHCLLVWIDEKIAGYTTYSFECSTWDASYYCHMDCLFVYETYRGFGIGETLVNKIKDAAKAKGCNLIQWQTPMFNERAIKFYYRIGATSKEKLRMYLKV